MPRARAMQCLLRIMAVLISAIALYCGSIAESTAESLFIGLVGGISATIIWSLSL